MGYVYSIADLHYYSPPGAGTFSRDFTTNLAPQCRAFSGALKSEKLKAPLFPGHKGAVVSNDWCISDHFVRIYFALLLLYFTKCL